MGEGKKVAGEVVGQTEGARLAKVPHGAGNLFRLRFRCLPGIGEGRGRQEGDSLTRGLDQGSPPAFEFSSLYGVTSYLLRPGRVPG